MRALNALRYTICMLPLSITPFATPVNLQQLRQLCEFDCVEATPSPDLHEIVLRGGELLSIEL